MTKSKAEEIDPNKNSTMTTMKSDQEKNIQLFVRDGNFLKAQRLANDLIKLAPENPKNWATKGWVMYEKKDFKAAIKAFENAIHLKPNAPTTLYFLALSREQIGDLAGAVEAYSLSHKLKPKADTLIGIGLIKKYKGETNAANELFREALKLDPTSELATNLLSDIAPG
jgi:tetratricopeptide (TPR) repeat protein